MLGFKGVIADVSERRHRHVANGEPALHLVMAGTVKNVRNPDRGQGRSRLHRGESRGIVDHVIGQQDFRSSPGLEVAGRGIVEAAENGNTGEKQNVGAVPEGMRLAGDMRRCGRNGRRFLGNGRRALGFRKAFHRLCKSRRGSRKERDHQPLPTALESGEHLGIVDGNSEVQSYPSVTLSIATE